MNAELDVAGGKPVLRLESKSFGYDSSKRAIFDLPLTEDQVRAITIHTGVGK